MLYLLFTISWESLNEIGYFFHKYLSDFIVLLLLIKWAITSKALRKYLAFSKCSKILAILLCLTIHFPHVNHYINIPEEPGRLSTETYIKRECALSHSSDVTFQHSSNDQVSTHIFRRYCILISQPLYSHKSRITTTQKRGGFQQSTVLNGTDHSILYSWRIFCY